MDSTIVVKLLAKDYPFTVIMSVGSISVMMFAYAVRICERPLTDSLGDQNYGDLTGSMWNVVVTMTTGNFY